MEIYELFGGYLPHSTKDYDNTCPICNYKAWWFVVFQYEITTYDSKEIHLSHPFSQH